MRQTTALALAIRSLQLSDRPFPVAGTPQSIAKVHRRDQAAIPVILALIRCLDAPAGIGSVGVPIQVMKGEVLSMIVMGAEPRVFLDQLAVFSFGPRGNR